MPAMHLSSVETGVHTHPSVRNGRRARVRTFSFTPRASAVAPRSQSVDPMATRTQTVTQQLAAPSPSLLALVVASTAAMLATGGPCLARLELPNKEVDDSTSPYVQELLKRTEENREKYKRERLQDYYRRNFKEYFEFEASNAKLARARGLSTESQEAIAKWLEENK